MKIFLPILLAFFAACSTSKNEAPAQTGPRQQATKVIISQAQKAQDDWRLTADKAEFFDTQNQVRLYSPVLISNKDGAQDATLKAKEGWFDIDKNLIILKDNVQIASLKEGLKIKASEVFYDTEKKEVWTAKPVKITRGKATLNAKGFKANQDFSEIELFNQKTTLPQNMQDFKPAPLTLKEALDEN